MNDNGEIFGGIIWIAFMNIFMMAWLFATYDGNNLFNDLLQTVGIFILFIIVIVIIGRTK